MTEPTTRVPAVFVGHGSPLNAITESPYTRAWQSIGRTTPRPRAILMVSAHWFIRSTSVTASAQPRTIHDFSGFPKELYAKQYPAPGDPALAAEIAQVLAPVNVRLDASWGFDHGAWSVLIHAYPQADLPVVQLSIDSTKPPAHHFDLGRRLSPLRNRGVLLMASGNIVHNLRAFDPKATTPHDWAVRFDGKIRTALERRDTETLVHYDRDPDARLAAPDIEHFLPVLYIAGARRDDDDLRFLVDGIEAGAISMRAFQVG